MFEPEEIETTEFLSRDLDFANIEFGELIKAYPDGAPPRDLKALYLEKREDLFDWLVESNLFLDSLQIEENLEYEYIDDRETLPVHAETGDDHIAFGSHPVLMALETVTVKEIFAVHPSMSDTFLSRTAGNFAEQWIHMPGQKSETASMYLAERSQYCSVLDIPLLRICLPVSRQSVLFSDTIQGKCELMGRRMSYVRPGDYAYNVVHLAALIQDALLNTLDGDKYPYLPKRLGGLDKQVPFNNANNVIESVFRYKHGVYKTLLFTIMQHTFLATQPGKDGLYNRSRFLEDVRKLYSGWQPWFVHYSAHKPKFASIIPTDFHKYEVDVYDNSVVTADVLRRLQHEGLLTTEEDLVMILSVQDHFRDLVSDKPYRESQKEREALHNEFRETQTFAWFDRYFHEHHFNVLLRGSIPPVTAEFIARMGTDDSLQIRQYVTRSKYFYRDALDQIYLKGPLRVPFVLTVGSRQIASNIFPMDIKRKDNEDVELLFRWLQGERIEPPPQKLIRDDEVLKLRIYSELEKINKQTYPTVLIITNDHRLCKEIAKQFSIRVLLLSPDLVLHGMKQTRVMRFDTMLSNILSLIASRIVYAPPQIPVYQDVGAVDYAVSANPIRGYTRYMPWEKRSIFNINEKKLVFDFSFELDRWLKNGNCIYDGYNPAPTFKRPGSIRGRIGMKFSQVASAASQLLASRTPYKQRGAPVVRTSQAEDDLIIDSISELGEYPDYQWDEVAEDTLEEGNNIQPPV